MKTPTMREGSCRARTVWIALAAALSCLSAAGGSVADAAHASTADALHAHASAAHTHAADGQPAHEARTTPAQEAVERRADTPVVRRAHAMATPPGAKVGAVYLDIISPQDDTLTGVSSPVADKAELHESLHTDGVARMRPLSRVELQAGKTYSFRPGGAHIMLVGLHQPLAAGARVPLTLHFAGGGAVEVEVSVVAPGQPSDASHEGHHPEAEHHHGEHPR